MAVTGIDHINIDTDRPDETVEFYRVALGLENRPDERPAFSTPGAWLFVGDRAVVHLNFVDETPPAGSAGAFNHIAFEAGGFDECCERLRSAGIDFQTSPRPDIDLRQIFFSDPNGIRIELNVRGAFD